MIIKLYTPNYVLHYHILVEADNYTVHYLERKDFENI